MQNPILKLEAGSFIFEKAGYFPEKLKHLTSSNYIQLIFFAEILRFRLTNDYKRVFEIFFCLDLELLVNMVSVSVQKPCLF